MSVARLDSLQRHADLYRAIGNQPTGYLDRGEKWTFFRGKSGHSSGGKVDILLSHPPLAGSVIVLTYRSNLRVIPLAGFRKVA